MIRNFKYIFVLILLSGVFSASVSAQNPSIKKADKLYDAMAWYKAVPYYEKGLKKEENPAARARLGDCYRILGRFADAEASYSKVVSSNGAKPEHYFQYATLLQSVGKYSEAKRWFQTWGERGGNPITAKTFAEFCDQAEIAKKDASAYKVTPLPFNTIGSEISPAIMGKQILYASTKGRGFTSRPNNLAQGKYFYDLYYGDPTATSPKDHNLLPKKINRRFHDGPAVCVADETLLYFTRSNYINGKLRKSEGKITTLKIFVSKKTGTGNTWSKPEPLNFNSDEYTCAHPSISADGNTLFFASDMPGGKGGSDIWFVRKEGESWGKPVNAGPAVNTSMNEFYPVIHETGKLMFASEGHPGFGGLDIFVADYEGGSYVNVRNMGYPLNSGSDDFGATFIHNSASGFFTTNREGGDDIVRFTRKIPVKIKVTDKFSGEPLVNASVEIADVNNQVTKLTTDSKGNALYYSDYGRDFMLNVNAKEYKAYREKHTTSNIAPVDELNIDVKLTKNYVFAINVKDFNTKADLQGVSITVESDDAEQKYSTDAKGNFTSVLNPESDYSVVLKKRGYKTQVFEMSTKGRAPGDPLTFNKELIPGSYLTIEGYTIDKESRAKIPSVNVRAIVDSTSSAVTVVSTKKGKYYMMVKGNVNQNLFGSRAGYFSTRLPIPGKDSSFIDTTIYRDIEMVKFEIGALVKMIYYEYNKSNIQSMYQRELSEIAFFMLDNPDAQVELKAHTDSRGTDKYNQELSEKRAKACVDFIESLGVADGRITSSGYGEKELTNGCKDNVTCTEPEHQANRRCEVRVTGLNGRKVEGIIPNDGPK